ncbi:DUF1592 domain-containing protein [Urbifossiella limnaea]|uniref:DUF1592 domain-containing protein n=1 Tax=Urbifossiella limnaea TaxID=2528023 RepID=A0A517XZA9_9BACT|nr:DUF1592 domain-containing protein [Urbifossiella limnaea]QDU22847.1 hypothetical protein ETAA1_48350 [Urbifossiella limnaea]
MSSPTTLPVLRRCWVIAPLLALACTVAPTGSADDAPPADPTFDRDVRPLLTRYCVRCHKDGKAESGVRVDTLSAALGEPQFKLWEHVQKQLADGSMPPEGATQPGADERKRAAEWIGKALAAARARPGPKNGLTRRLTVAQYRNTLRELLRLDDELADRLPPDAVSKDGFVNNKDTLQLSPLLLEAYFEVAEAALDRCVVDPAAKPTIQTFRVDLGRGINPAPIKDNLILGADSLLLENRDWMVTELAPEKGFAYTPFRMRTKYRFIEGYQGNDTVRGWRDYDSIYHSVFACLRGTRGYPKGRAYDPVPQGLLLRPAIPSSEVFGADSTYGPRANFRVALRELPDHGRFRVTVTAAKYDDGLLLDPGAKAGEGPIALAEGKGSLTIPAAGVYQVDVTGSKAGDLTLTLGGREFTGSLKQPAFVVVRLPAGLLAVDAKLTGGAKVERVALTPLPEESDLAKRFAAFEKRAPRVGVHLGFRRDCGSTLAPVGAPQTVSDTGLSRFVFEGAIRNYPSPDVEKDNVNYLAGVREIGVRSEYADGRDVPRLLVKSVEFEGPLHETWPPREHRAIFTDADGRKLIRDFATRAYRRPVTAQEEATLVGVFEKSLASGRGFRDSVKDALLVALTSPQFLFLVETSATPAAEPLDGYELASKLSYFLWNGPPDDTTLKLAAAGELRGKLDAEVARLVTDARFGRFVTEFAAQWLALDKFQVLEPDRARFPHLTRDTRVQLRREPAEFLQHLFRNNLPARDLIASDYVLANETVAGYYGLGDRTESGFEFVPVRHGRRELGGVLTQPAVLAGLSDGREPNPVKRGAWLARRIVAEPPDDPPPNVPALQDDTKKLSLRERLEKHRNAPGCAGCHAKIDPWGLPFEEYDAGGKWRAGATDTRSTLPDKTVVTGFTDLRRYLADDRLDQVAFSVLKHLATYAVGRTLSYSELDWLRREGLKLKPTGYRMQDMIRLVVTSPAFLEK